ncbi:MAG TPA: transporter [Desulfocapsa sulfexigens]|nr:transporter [Desulfocapsa sulfexigens]
MNHKKYFFLCCLMATFLLLNDQEISAAPITFNTALPVAKGETVVRIQTKLLRSTDDPSGAERDLTVWALPLVGPYGITEKLALFGILPILDKEMETDTVSGKIKRGESGIGDFTAMVRYTFWKKDAPGKTMRLAPFLAIKIPTGEDDATDGDGKLPQPLQLGTGSWDYSLGLVMTRQTLARQFDASISYTLKTEANGFEFGDEAHFDLSYQHRIWPRELTSGVPGFVYGVLETNLIWQDNNTDQGIEDADSGGVSWFLAPGIQYVTRRTVLELAVQIPVAQNLNGTALENDFISTLSFRMNF